MIEIAFGAGLVSTGGPTPDVASLKPFLDVLQREGVRKIDTAQGYGNSEEILGASDMGHYFTIDTKIKGGFAPGSTTRKNVIEDAKQSLNRLNVDKIDILYIHAPDYETPISETLAGINEVMKSGKFTRFGLSNYKPQDVERVYEHCKSHGYILPTVYQGNYSAVARKYESTLFPVLRKLGIAFYAYAALAGGFLTKTKEEILNGAGRFKEGEAGADLYIKLYKKQAYIDALAGWKSISELAGCSQAELAYRWVAHNSQLHSKYGDGLVIGARNAEQLQQTLNSLKAGLLSPEVCSRIDEIWDKLEASAPTDNFHL